MFVPIKIETRPFYWIVVGLQFVLKEFLGFLGIVKQTTKCTCYERYLFFFFKYTYEGEKVIQNDKFTVCEKT
jgi:hypothetical protein